MSVAPLKSATPAAPVEPPKRPVCVHQEACGSCALITLPYDAQLEAKREAVLAALRRFPRLRALVDASPGFVPATVASPLGTGYRTRAKVVVSLESDARVSIGLYQPGSHDLVDLPHCAVLPEGARRLLALLRTRLAAAPELARALRHAVVRWSFYEARAHLVLVAAAGLRPAQRRELRRLGEELCRDPQARVAGVALSVQPEPGPDGSPPVQVLGPELEPLAGEPWLVESLGALRFRVSPGSFFQANLAQAERISALCDAWFAGADVGATVTAVTGRTPATRPAHGPHGTLVDLYAGVGPLAIGLCRQFERVIAVEAHPASGADARHNARDNDARHVEVWQGQAEHRASRLVPEIGRARAVVVNPPRRGCKPEVLRAAAELRPERMAYVSCDPETLARDLDSLLHLGYVTRTVVPLDMFPHTAHVESVALLERAPARAPAGGRPLAAPLSFLYEDEDLVALDKPGHLPVHAGSGHDDSLLGRLLGTLPETHEAGQRAVPLTRLDLGASGVVLVARRAAMLAAFARLQDAGAVDRRLVVLVRGHLRKKGVITRPLADRRTGRQQPAQTRYWKIADVGGHSLAELQLVTARPHQARRHLAQIGHPVIGDARYGDRRTNRHFEERLALSRPFVHVARLGLPHPRTGRYLSLEAPLPGDLELVLDRLRRRDG